MSDFFRKRTAKELGWSKEQADCDHPIMSRRIDRNCDELPSHDENGESILEKVIVTVEYCNDCGKNFGADYSPAGIDDCYHS